ncbi:MAG: class I fructose-bisphosphate aldolase [Holophagaceae bacterium]|jgi:class I fructose-bisphosphate aldolase
MTKRTDEILSWYKSDSPMVRENLKKLLTHGELSGTGKFVILPVDQGFEHGPARSFAVNPPSYDPNYHVELAIESGCNAYAAPLGFIEFVASEYRGKIPFILKLNNSDVLSKGHDPQSAITASVKDALRLGCTAVGYTIYPGSALRNQQYEALRKIIAEARDAGLPTVVWAYPRGQGLSKEGETAVDVIAYAAHLSCQLGAHIVKVKPPKDHIEHPAALEAFKKASISTSSLKDRISEVVRSSFAGKRIVIFSGGETKSKEEILKEVSEIAAGGGFGSIMGRNAFQRPRSEALTLLREVMDIYKAS